MVKLSFFFLNHTLQICLNSPYNLQLDFGPILIHIQSLGKALQLPLNLKVSNSTYFTNR